MLSVKDVQHRADDIRLQRCCGTLALSPDSESGGSGCEYGDESAALRDERASNDAGQAPSG
jgi:hypothetical protein